MSTDTACAACGTPKVDDGRGHCPGCREAVRRAIEEIDRQPTATTADGVDVTFRLLSTRLDQLRTENARLRERAAAAVEAYERLAGEVDRVVGVLAAHLERMSAEGFTCSAAADAVDALLASTSLRETPSEPAPVSARDECCGECQPGCCYIDARNGEQFTGRGAEAPSEPPPAPPCGHRSGVHDEYCDVINDPMDDELDEALASAMSALDWAANHISLAYEHLRTARTAPESPPAPSPAPEVDRDTKDSGEAQGGAEGLRALRAQLRRALDELGTTEIPTDEGVRWLAESLLAARRELAEARQDLGCEREWREIAEQDLTALRADLVAAHRERDEAKTEAERMRPVVNAASSWSIKQVGSVALLAETIHDYRTGQYEPEINSTEGDGSTP